MNNLLTDYSQAIFLIAFAFVTISFRIHNYMTSVKSNLFFIMEITSTIGLLTGVASIKTTEEGYIMGDQKVLYLILILLLAAAVLVAFIGVYQREGTSNAEKNWALFFSLITFAFVGVFAYS